MNEKITSDQLISHHRVREDYEESPQNTIQFAYNDHRYVKFTYELTNESNILKEKILKQVEEDFSLENYQILSCENIDLCLKSSDLITALFRLIKDPNEEIKKLATNCITKICASSFGRKQIINKNLIEPFHHIIHDTNTEIRKSVTTGLLNFTSYKEGIDHLVSSKIILIELVDKIATEKNWEVLNNIIKILKNIMQGETATDKALETEILQKLVNLINHQNEQIRFNVCMTLANISFNENGKEDIVTSGYIYEIKPKLRDPDVYVREASCLLLCSLAQLNQGKIEILDDPQDFETIIELLGEPAPTALNAVQLISSLAEHPKGRQLSEKYINKILELKNVEKIYIDAAIEVIKWKP